MTRSFRFPRPLAALLLLGAMVFGTSTAFAQKADGLHPSLSSSPATEAGTPASSVGGQNLILDDGGAEDSIGLTAGGTFLWLNRFTPPAGDFPMQLQSADVLFTTAGGFPAGSTFDIFVWSDADGNPANGATLVGSATGNTVGVLDVFQTVTFSAPLAITTVGDVLIGARVTALAGEFPAAIDQTALQVRSWAGFGAGAEATPPTLPTATFGTIDSFGLPGNWLIRGTYTTGGGGGPFLSVSPSSVPFGGVQVGTTAGPTTVTLTNSGTETLTISSIALSGNSAFSINTTGTSLSLAAGASTTMSASFAPTTTGAVTGAVTITSNAPSSPNTVSLTGEGTSFVTFPSTDTPLAITDNLPSGITSTIVIPGSETRNIADLDVALTSTHSWIGDLAASLARGGTTVGLMDRPGVPTTTFGCSGDNMDIVVDDEGTAGAMETGCVNATPAYTADGRYTPDSPLSVFDATPMAGTYVLTVSDNAAGDTGTLDSWALLISPDGGGGPSPISMVTVRQPDAPLPSAGGDARIAFRFTNLTPEAIATTTWAEIEIPGGGLITIPGDLSRLMMPRPLSLAPSGSPEDNRRWGIRFVLLAAAPAGEYRYTRYAGTQGGAVLASETVTFVKTAPTFGDARAATFGTPDADEAVVSIGADGAMTVLQMGAPEALATTAAATTTLRVSPNPMTTQGQAVLSVATTQAVRVALYDALGREVRVLLDRSLTAGQEAHIGFRTNDLPAGVYVVRATGTDVSLTERITVVR